jgi:hypothetical protein
MNRLQPSQNFSVNPALMPGRPCVIKGKKSCVVLIDR